MRIPIKLLCSECDAEITENLFHAIIGGVVFRFCCETHRTAYRRKRVQVEHADVQQTV